MGHALPDCIGITNVDDDTSEYAILEDRADELEGYRAPGGWFTRRWLDDSGAMFIWSKHDEGYYNGSAHYNGTATTTLGELEWIDESVYITASVFDGEHEVTRLCAAFGQFPSFGELDPDAQHAAVITGLAMSVTIYDTPEAFGESEHGDLGPLDPPVEMPDGTTMDRLRYAVDHFIPAGMFGRTNPMASFSGVVDEAFAYTVRDTGATVHVARVTVLDCMPIYVCWPEYHAPVPAPGNVIQVSAYLTAFMPSLWRDRTAA